jgi:hypothetical protein
MATQSSSARREMPYAFPALTVINTSELTGGEGQLANVYFNWLYVSPYIYAVEHW